MPTARIIASPPRVQHLDIFTSQEELQEVLPEIITCLPPGVNLDHFTLAWRGYRDLDDFIIDKATDLVVDGSTDDILIYANNLVATGLVGNIITYIINKEGDVPISTLVVVDPTEDDVELSKIVKLAGITFIDGFLITVRPWDQGGRVYRIIAHFMLSDNTTAATRTSLLYTRLIHMGLDVRLLLTDRDSMVYYMQGELISEEVQEEVLGVDEPKYTPGSLDELRYNLKRESEDASES